MADRPAPNRIVIDFGQNLTILVGAAQQSFSINKDVIYRKSEYIKDVCDRRAWHRGRDKTVALPDIEPNDFQSYAIWVTTDHVQLETHGDESEERATELTVKLYAAAHKLQDRALRNAIIRRWRELHRPCTMIPYALDITHLYENVEGTCKLKDFIVELYVRVLDLHWSNDNMSRLPQEFKDAVAKGALQGVERENEDEVGGWLRDFEELRPVR